VFLHLVVVECSEVSEENTASIFRWTELVQVDAEVFGGKKCVGYIEWFEGVWPSQLQKTKGGDGIVPS
jgi:hypothetical protein